MARKMQYKRMKQSVRRNEPPGNAEDYDALGNRKKKRLDSALRKSSGNKEVREDIKMQRGGNPPR